MTIAVQIVTFIAYAFFWFGLPAALAAYGLLVLGRKIAGRAGMRVGTILGFLLICAPFLWLMASALAQGAPLSALPSGAGDSFKWIHLLGIFMAMILSAAGMLFLAWSDQSARIARRS